jgi:hypothetical protein
MHPMLIRCPSDGNPIATPPEKKAPPEPDGALSIHEIGIRVVSAAGDPARSC